MYNHNKAQQSKNHVHISWDILYSMMPLYLCTLFVLITRINGLRKLGGGSLCFYLLRHVCLLKTEQNNINNADCIAAIHASVNHNSRRTKDR